MTEQNDQVEIKDEDTVEEDFTAEEIADDKTDWKAKALEAKGIAKRRATQLKKAQEKLKSASATVSKPETPTEKNASQKSGELDYSEKAYLKASGISGSDELALVKMWKSRTGDDLDTLIDDGIFQAKLEGLRQAKATKVAASVTSSRSNNTTSDQADYWVQKISAGTAQLGDIPDIKLRRQVLNARIQAEKNETRFSPNPIVSN